VGGRQQVRAHAKAQESAYRSPVEGRHHYEMKIVHPNVIFMPSVLSEVSSFLPTRSELNSRSNPLRQDA
jgi:hypothetical protein